MEKGKVATFEELVIKAKQALCMQDMLTSEDILEENGMGMTDDEFYDFQSEYINLLESVKDEARTVYPEILFMKAETRLAQLKELKEDENADLVDIQQEEDAINMVISAWKPSQVENMDETPEE